MKIIYIDLDNVVVDFPSAFDKIKPTILETYKGNEDEIPHIFSLMKPMPKSVEAVSFLSKYFEIYFLSTAPWKNPSAWSDKVRWIQQYFPEIGYKKLILSHHKNLLQGDYLIDDRKANGTSNFKGEHIHFGTHKLENWSKVLLYICGKENIAKPYQLIYKNKQELTVNTFQKDIKNFTYLLEQKLHQELFPEEYDFIYDSFWDAKDRKNGKNPMKEEYIAEVNLKREAMGISILKIGENFKDDSSQIYCKKLIKEELNKYYENN